MRGDDRPAVDADRWSNGMKPIRAVAVLGLMLVLPCRLAAGGDEVPEHELKAAFLYNFARFTEWPEDDMPPGEPLELCIADAAVAGALEALVNRKFVGDHPLVVRQLTLSGRDTATIRPLRLRYCEVLYVAQLDLRTAVAVLGRVNDAPVLTVGETEDFTRMGGVARFFVERGRLRFEINTTSAQHSKLQLSAKLLQLARIVKD